MADNYINVTVTSKQNKRVTVSTQDPGFEVTATTDTGKFWAKTAENWATSDTIVENKDYSSKYYANKAKVNAENARVYEASAKETYNSLIAESNSISNEIRTTGNEVIDNINSTKTNILKDIEFVADGEKEEIQELAEDAKADIKSTGFYMRDDKLYFINSKGEEEEFKSGGGGGLEIGDIGIAPLGIDETQGKRRYLNGQLIIQEQYVQFTEKVKSAVALYPSLACTEEEWQTTATMTVGGQVGKFVVDDEAGTIRLPKIIMPIQGLTDLSKLGEIVEAGLPNITGEFRGRNAYNSDAILAEGAFTTKVADAVTGAQQSGENRYTWVFDASLSNPIYGNSDTVQQEQIQYPYFIQVATGAEVEDNIINEIELNNPFSLLDYKFSEYELNNASWLHSNGQYNSKAIYPAVYDLLLKIYNGTETKAGVSVKLSTETFTDYDFVLNTAEETFRLPTAVKQTFFNGINGNIPVVGNGMTLGLTDGTTSYGLNTYNPQYGNSLIGRTVSYGTDVGDTTNSGNISQAHLSLGVTTDATKSGLVAQVSQSEVNGLYLYFYVGETVQNANLINAGRIEEKLSDCVTRSSLVEVQTVIETYQNGTSWYRVWSDGWCEQGGQTAAGTSITVTLLKTYKDTNYNVQLTCVNKAQGDQNWTCSSKTTTSFVYSNSESFAADWQACGYIY